MKIDRSRPNRISRVAVAPVLLLVVSLAACGSAASKSSGGSSATTATKGSTPAGNASSRAPDTIVVATLLAPAKLSGSGVSLSAVEDDGGTSTSQGFISVAQVATAHATAVVTLDTYASPDAAVAAYQQFSANAASAGATAAAQPIAGAGDQAIAAGTAAYARKGAQVLSVVGKITAADQDALNQAKATGKLDPGTIATYTAAAAALAKRVLTAVAPNLTGATVPSANLTYVPKNAIDPCTVPASSLDHGDIHVTSQPVGSDSPPAMECIYSFNGSRAQEPGTGQLAVYTLTEAQAESAVPATTVDQVFAAIPQQSVMGPQAYNTSSDANLQAEATDRGELDSVFDADIKGPQTAVGKLLVRIRDEASSYVVDKEDCRRELAKLFGTTFDDPLQQIRKDDPEAYHYFLGKIADKINDWCDGFNPNP